MELEFIKSVRGKDHLVFNGYRYIKERETKAGKITWNCIDRRHHKCTARLHTLQNNVVKSINEHNHVADASKLCAQKVVLKIIHQAETTTDSPQSIVAAASENLEPSVSAQLPSPVSMKRNIQRHRNIIQAAPALPNTRQDLVIPAEYKLASNGSNFLLFDSGPEPGRIIVFGTEENLNLLERSRDWFLDGTFKASPEIFEQVYTVHGLVQNSVVPLIFALLPDKKQETYIRLFTGIMELRPSLNPRTIMTDFELAAKNALRVLYPEAVQFGCNFHFGQCLFRRLQQHGSLQIRFRNEPSFALKIKCLSALAFVPPPDVVAAFESLVQDPFYSSSEDIRNFMDYFETTWIGKLRRSRRRQQPMFPIPDWNIHERIVQNIAKTNNAVEGWHRGFQSILGGHHPTIWRLIKALKREQSLNQLKITQYLAGGTPPLPRKRYRDCAKRIKRVVDDYVNRTKVDYLESIAHNINLNV